MTEKIMTEEVQKALARFFAKDLIASMVKEAASKKTLSEEFGRTPINDDWDDPAVAEELLEEERRKLAAWKSMKEMGR